MSWSRLVISVLLISFYAIVESFWRPFLSQLQAINAASVLNDHSVEGNTLSQVFRSGDPVSFVLTIALIALLLMIWWAPLKKAFNSQNNY